MPHQNHQTISNPSTNASPGLWYVCSTVFSLDFVVTRRRGLTDGEGEGDGPEGFTADSAGKSAVEAALGRFLERETHLNNTHHVMGWLSPWELSLRGYHDCRGKGTFGKLVKSIEFGKCTVLLLYSVLWRPPHFTVLLRAVLASHCSTHVNSSRVYSKHQLKKNFSTCTI